MSNGLLAESEGFKYLVGDVRPYKKYRYNLKDDSVEEVEG